MNYRLTIFLFFFAFLSVRAQENLVRNPGFETYDNCPASSGEFTGFVTGWATYFANPEYMNCGYKRFDEEFPRTGDGYAGAYLFFPTAPAGYYFREYLHGQLSEPLQADSFYYAEFHVRPFSRAGFIDRYEMAVTAEPLDSTSPTNGVLDVIPVIAHDGGIIMETEQYTKISGCFTARGGERYLTLGNFNTDPETAFVSSEDSLERSNYSYFDDVGIYRFSFEHLLNFDTTICAGSCITIPNRIGGSYQWRLAGASPGNSQEASPQDICYEEAGAFDIELVVEHCAGKDTLLIENAVTVVPRPPLAGDTLQRLELTSGDSLQLAACAEGDAYAWSPAAGLSCTDCPNPLAFPGSNTTYTLQITNGGQCVLSCSYDIQVLPRPDARFELSADTICSGGCISAIYTGSTPDAGLLFWSFEGGNPASFSGLNPPEACFEEAGVFEISLQVDNEAGTATATRRAVVLQRPVPIADIPAIYRLQFGDTLRLQACASGADYQWQSASGLSCTDCRSPLLEVAGNDTVQLQVSNGGYCPLPCQFFIEATAPDKLYLPNAFSPNDDGRNDYFQPYGPYHETISLEVFSRWGGMLYRGTGPDARWDGNSAGRAVSSGLYAYLLRYVDTRSGEERRKAGEVLLVR